MEKISAIICEFNPLHEGHRYVIGEAKKYGPVVCVMSGNFVQRGECAVADKYVRAKDAIEAGADLVVELPFPWCAAPAEFFARAGVTVAASLGATDLVFGSESGDLEIIRKAAALYDDESFRDRVFIRHSDSVGYAEARYAVAQDMAPDAAEVFNSSNDSLAAEYIRQSGGLGFEFHALRRLEGYSAEKIREESGFTHRLFDIERELFCLGRNHKDSFDSASGVINRLERCAAASSSGYDMLRRAKTKKYTDARLRRAALFAVTGVTKEDLASEPDFTVLLAANGKGREILNGARGIEIVTKPADAVSYRYAHEALADRLYTLCIPTGAAADDFLKKSPHIC